MNTKLNPSKCFKKEVFGMTEFQTLLVHLNQTIVWLQIVKTFSPKGKLKEEINKAINILSILSKRFPISDDLFDKAIDISDSLFKITSLSQENQEILINLIKEKINELHK